MSLEQAMAEVRRYLDAKRAGDGTGSYFDGNTSSRQFALLGSAIGRLSQVAATQGTVDPNSKAGPLGVYLKRLIRKAIGWYSRPIYEFDRTVIEAFEQTRLDMLGLQQQIQTLAAERRGQTEQTELLRSVIELLFANIASVQSLRQAIRNDDPAFQQRFDDLLTSLEGQLADARNELLDRLPNSPNAKPLRNTDPGDTILPEGP